MTEEIIEETEVLEEEIEETVESESTEPEHDGPTLQAMKDGEIVYSRLDKEDKIRLTREARESLEDEEMKTAWDMGWRSSEFFAGKNRDGSEREFIDHKQFLDKIEKNAPVKNERIRTLRERDAEKDRRIEQLQDEVRKAVEIAKMTQDRFISSDEDRLNAQIQEAKDNLDFDAYEALQAKKLKLEGSKEKLRSYEEPKAEEPVQTEVQPEVREWGARNNWFYTDQPMRDFAIRQEDILRETRPDLDLSERLEIVTQSAKISFPDKFEEAPRKQLVLPSKNSGNFAKPKAAAKGFSSLPDRERMQANQMIRKGVFKNEADFMESYNKLK